MKSFLRFINEGKREEAEINRLLDKGLKNLSDEEKDLLRRLSSGESLPEEERASLKMHKTGGGYLYDDEGNIMTEEEPEIKPGQEFVTAKGKMRSADKLPNEEIIDARVYRNKDSEERFIFSHVTLETESGVTHDWLIYRTGGSEFGMFMNTNSEKFKYYKLTPPEVLWKEKDHQYDYCMVLDQDLYEDFVNFAELYKENQKRNNTILRQLHNRFRGLL